MAKCHVAFLPMSTASGHMIPMVDMAVLMAFRGVKTTIITTTLSTHRFFKAVEQTINCDHQITLHTFKPKADPSNVLALVPEYKQPVEDFLEESRPNCIISDVFFTWSTKVAAKFNIPRIIFDPAGIFSRCVSAMITLHEPQKTVSSDSEPFTIPNLPDEIMFTKKQMAASYEEEQSEFVRKLMSDVAEADRMSYGCIFNTFYEVEPEYVNHFRQVLKKRVWNVGPVSLFCKNTEDKLERGGKSVIDEQDCCKWLDLKKPNSVVYINFGSVLTIASAQVYEIAMALEACNHDFIWAVKKDEESSLPPGFEERMSGKGLIIKGWAPQVLILEHVSVGGFMTHAGWGSILESICGEVGMVTWPVSSDQFSNAKLVTYVLKTGVPIGDDVEWKEDQIIQGVKRETIQKALERIMSPKEGGEIRKRVHVLKDKAQAAVKEGGSSYSDLTAFIEEMKAIKFENKDN